MHFAIPVFVFLNVLVPTQCYPLPHGNSQSDPGQEKRGIQVDNAQDEWANLIAGVAPLILLVGERVTKQHLRESSSRADYYLLGATPFGLITSVVSLLR